MNKRHLAAALGIISLLIIVAIAFFYNRNIEQQEALRRQQELWKAEYPTIYLRNDNFQVQIGMFGLYGTKSADIVMLGNSHTYYANWSELLDTEGIVNRGIVGDITAGYLHRLRYVYDLTPKLCFLEGGVNDLYANYTVKTIAQHFRQILDTLQTHRITPVITATFYVSKRWPNAALKNAEIASLNDSLRALCVDRDIIFLDINPTIAPNGFLDEAKTYDGIHLNSIGYSAWSSAIRHVLDKTKR